MHDEMKVVFENRSNLYRLLGQIYLREVTPELFNALQNMTFPTDSGDVLFDQGCREITQAVRTPAADPLEDLAVDYARVFLGAGIAKGVVAYPFESVYTSPGHLIMQDAWEKVLLIFREHGLGRNEQDLPEDHLAFELQFMAYLSDRALEAVRHHDDTALLAALTEQKHFLEEHILNWTPRFFEDLEHCSGTAFYQGVAKMTQGFLAMDKALLDELSAPTA